MIRAWASVAIGAAAAIACSSSVTGTGSSASSSSGGASGTTSSSGASSGASCSVTLYGDQSCEHLFEQSCCAEGETCFDDITCESVAFCRANCAMPSGVCNCGTSDTKGYGAALEACIHANLPPACQLR